MYQPGGNQYTLLHSLGIHGNWRMPPRLQAKQLKQPMGLELNLPFAHPSQPAYQLQVFHSRQVVVQMRFFGHVSQCRPKTHQVVPYVPALEQDSPLIWLQQPGNDLDGGRFSRTVGSQVADNFARIDAEINVRDGGDAAIAFRQVLELKHRTGP